MAAPYTGQQTWLQHSIAGGETPAYVAFDGPATGAPGHGGGGTQEEVGAGGIACDWREPYWGEGSSQGKLQSLGLLGCVIPTAVDVLPPVIALIQGGPKTDASAALEHSTCYLTSTKISLKYKGALEVAHSWIALGVDDCTMTAAAAIANSVFPWHKIVVELGGAAYKLQTLELELKYDAEAKGSCDEKVAGAERASEWIALGILKASLKTSLAVPLEQTNDFRADVVDRFTFSLVATNTDATAKTLTIGGAGDGWGIQGEVKPVVAGKEDVLFEVNATGRANDLALVTFAFDDGEA